MNPPTVLQAAGAGAVAYSSLFFLLSSWVFLDAWWRGERPFPPALATLFLGWAGLAIYLATRRERLVPCPVRA